LDKRSDCTTVTVASGDSCGSLATECGISAADFTKYNNATSLCANLTPGQRVCCSAGTLPDVTPKENANGTCFAYTIQSGDNCALLSAKYDLTNAKIESFNNGTTWGWFGCQNVLADLNICLSTGYPPLPNPVAGTECGPTLPGTVMPTNGTALDDLNQCPLNACCDIWGQCGITPEYCTNTTGPAGNPGTAPPGDNGCISNCGTAIANSDVVPTDFISVGYYESWNWDRPCLNFRAADVDTTLYTHVHWAFATIDDNFNVVINDTYSQWADFKALPVKRIVSFGGWGYSTSADTYNQLRVAMNPDNFLTFVDNIIKFLNDEDLDGVDFDWEYPGAPDIPGIPPGLASDGPNYFTFLGALRGTLGLDTTKTISFAAPASYWYLQHFPVKQMAGEVDYVVYMTYDLHGQWDYGNTWSQEGCADGNCLRSHVNLTETMYTLAMITKAGVPTYKVTVGVSSYGRSFGMADASCTGPECTFTGSSTESTAAVGECTLTGGYISNAEILDFVNANVSVTGWYDADTDSNYLVYKETNWVAYMTDDVKTSRKARYQGLNFAGTVDWAVDLAHWSGSDGDPDGTDDSCTGTDDDGECNEGDPLHPWTPCDADISGSLDDLSDDTIAGWPTHCVAQYTLEALSNLLADALQNFTDLMANGYDSKFDVYAKSVAASADTQVHNFLQAQGNDYFTCVVTEFQMCCSQCEENSPGGSYCDYCLSGSCYKNNKRGDYNPQNNRQLITSWTNVTEPCPPDYSKRGYGPDNPYEQTLYWSLQDDKADAFYADILNATGIPKDKIGFGLYTDADMCSGSGNKPGNGADCWNTGYEFGAPFPNGYGAADVTNPEALAKSGLDNSADLPGQISDMIANMKALSFLGDGFAVVDAVSLPIMMIAQGVESMSIVVQTADKIEEEERKAIILAFISAILFFVPIAGELVGAVAEVADIVAIIDVLGAVGNAAMDIYTVVDDPANAPLAIVDLIMAPLALADVAIVAKAAELKRGMSVEDMAKLGDRVGERMSKVTKGTGKCTA
jgi:chitinase